MAEIGAPTREEPLVVPGPYTEPAPAEAPTPDRTPERVPEKVPA